MPFHTKAEKEEPLQTIPHETKDDRHGKKGGLEPVCLSTTQANAQECSNHMPKHSPGLDPCGSKTTDAAVTPAKQACMKRGTSATDSCHMEACMDAHHWMAAMAAASSGVAVVE